MKRIYLSKKVKMVLAGVAAGAIVVVSIAVLPSGKINLCTSQQCYDLSKSEYTNLKMSLIQRAEQRIPISWEEYNLLVKIYDYEIKNAGKIPLIRKGRIAVEQAKLDQELLDKLSKIILK